MSTAIAQMDPPREEQFISPPPPKPAPAKLTWQQAEKLAAGRPYELINGRMIFKMPDNKHSDTHGLLCGLLFAYFKGNPIGRVRPEYMLHLWPEKPHEGRMPDLSVILNESLREESYGSRAPDLAIEIVSPNDTWSELFEKARLYLAKGSRVVWIVDSEEQAVMVITTNDRLWVKDTLTCPELLPGFSVPVQEIFVWPSTPAGKSEATASK
ncbi:Uma2 family endonuclease [candidate division KSB1 bacterium]|nr:Uma2 family endonuclease [candidate division KSB1 bacterium]